MGYTHYFTKQKDVPDEQWQALCKNVALLFNKLPQYDLRTNSYPNETIMIYDPRGIIPIIDSSELFVYNNSSNFIEFNGNRSLGMHHEAFILRQTGKQEPMEWFCKTAQKPYDWLVTAVLILANQFCPDCFDIESDGAAQEWWPVLIWINEMLQTSGWSLPPKVA